MSLETLVTTLEERAIELSVEGEDLRCRAPKGALTAELKREIALHKSEIVALLRVGGWESSQTTLIAFRDRASRRPDAIAMSFGSEHFSYEEIGARSESLASELRSRGAGPEAVVGLKASSPFHAVVGALAIVESGAACLPLRADSGNESDRGTSLLVDEDVVVGEAVPPTSHVVTRRHLAFILETAGVTGPPRRVALDRGSLARALRIGLDQTSFGPDDVIVARDDIRTGIGWLQRLLPLAAGGKLVLTEEVHPSVEELRRAGASVVLAAPTALRALLAAGSTDGFAGTRVISTGEPLDEGLSKSLGAAGCDVLDVYGCLEAGMVSAAAGRPLEGARLYVLGAEQQPVAIGAPGEVHVGGEALARGYMTDGAATAERFVPDSLGGTPGARLFRTGDRARWSSSGRIELLGRVSEPTGWLRVESVLREHPQVRDAALAVEGRGSSRERLVAHVVAAGGTALASSLAGYVKGKISPHLEPTRFLPVESLPVTPAGKLDRRALDPDRLPLARVVPPRLPGAELDQLLPRTNLTKNQLLVWAGQTLEPDIPLYNIGGMLRIEGEFYPEHAGRAFQALIDASDALRTVIEDVDGVPHQKVLPHFDFEVELHDLSTEPDPDAALETWAKKQCQMPFDLAERLFRAAIVKSAEREHALFIVQHHLISDAWSFGLTAHHCAELYQRSLSGDLNEPPTLPRFADFVAFEAQRRDGPVYLRAKEYWQRKLVEDPDPIAFYSGDARKRGTRVERVTFELSDERSRDVKALASSGAFATTSVNLSRFIIFATVLFAYLHRVSGNRLLSVGTTILNRASKQFKETLGLFMQVAPLRVKLSAEDTFRSLAGRLLRDMQDSMRHSRYTFGNSAQRQLYDVLLNYETVQFQNFNDMPSQLQPVYRDHATDSLGLLVRDYTQSGKFSLDFDFHCDLFTEPQRALAYDHFLCVLDSLLRNPDQRLSEVSLLSAGESSRIEKEISRGDSRLARGSSVVALFEERVRSQPDAIAVQGEDEALSYRELDGRANQLARRLIALGARGDVPVGLSVERSPAMVVGLFGILKAGAAYVPLDPAYPQKRLELMMRGVDLGALVVPSHLRSALPEFRGPVVELEPVKWTEEGGRRPPRVPVHGEELAYVIFTSGSTGVPNAVGVSHRSLAHYAEFASERFELAPGDRPLQFASISFDISVEEIFSCLVSGATLVLRTEPMGSSVDHFLAKCAELQVTVANLPTAYWHELTDELSGRPTRLPESVRLVIAGGDKMLPDRLRAWRERVGETVQLLNGYGPTEATVVATFSDLTPRGGVELSEVSVGRPIHRVQTFVVDDQCSLLPLEVAGELCIGGAGLARGYLSRPDLTAEKFVPSPFGEEPGARLYRTGDRARIRRDANIDILGRVDHQVKIRGYRVELSEIESALTRHPAIRRAAVATRPSRSGGMQLVAYLEWDTRHPWSTSEMRAFLKERLADYMVPAAFVRVEALPLLPSGKTDRRALPAPPDSSTLGSEREYVAPRTPIEEELCRVWEEVLEIERVGIHDDFFELGGHSLTAIQLVSRVRQSLGTEVPFHRLFETPTVAGLAQLMESAEGGGSVADDTPDLEADVVLDPLITAPAREGRRVEAPAKVFLTGATGFLGAYLLHELLARTEAEVHCLVRCETEEDGIERIRQNLDQFSLWSESVRARIVVVPGDLALPLLGLSEERFDALANRMDAIYHCGAWVTGIYPYQTLKASNVYGTQEALRLASRGRWKPFHHVSTTSVHRGFGYSKDHVLLEDAPLDSAEGVVVGYSQTKWVAEKLVAIARSRGMPVAVYRPGQVTGDSAIGVCHTDDVWCRILKTLIELGSAPESPDPMQIELTPVDYVAKALVHLSLREDSLGRAFHLVNPQTVRLDEAVDWARNFGYEIRGLPFAEWGDALERFMGTQETALAPLMPLIESTLSAVGSSGSGSASFPPRLDNGNVLRGLESSGITCPVPSEELMSTYLSYFVRSGYLPPAPGGGDEDEAGVGSQPEVNVEG